jgi:hypothetical protein
MIRSDSCALSCSISSLPLQRLTNLELQFRQNPNPKFVNPEKFSNRFLAQYPYQLLGDDFLFPLLQHE